MQILIRNAAIDDFLKEVAASFRALCPAEYEMFRKHVKEESHRLVKPSGMSRDGCFLNKMFIPQKLYTFIKWQARKRLGIPDFFADKENYYRLCRMWPDSVTRRKPTVFIDKGSKEK